MKTLKVSKSFLIISLALFGMLILGGCEKEKKSSVGGDNIKTDIYEGWQTYQNEEYGFEMRYPESWVVEESEKFGPVPGLDINSKNIFLFPNENCNYKNSQKEEGNDCWPMISVAYNKENELRENSYLKNFMKGDTHQYYNYSYPNSFSLQFPFVKKPNRACYSGIWKTEMFQYGFKNNETYYILFLNFDKQGLSKYSSDDGKRIDKLDLVIEKKILSSFKFTEK